MAQIAQQDNLIIETTGALAAMDGTIKQKLIDCIKTGTITDVMYRQKLQTKFITVKY